MTYELAKQLKEAGFPQELKEGSFYQYECSLPCLATCDCSVPEGAVKLPSLPELIDACGNGMQILHQTTDTDNGLVEWRCGSALEPNMANGSTPEEAVSELWLKLNKKL